MENYQNNLSVAKLTELGLPTPYAQAVYSWAGEVQWTHEITISQEQADKLYELFARAQKDTA